MTFDPRPHQLLWLQNQSRWPLVLTCRTTASPSSPSFVLLPPVWQFNQLTVAAANLLASGSLPDSFHSSSVSFHSLLLFSHHLFCFRRTSQTFLSQVSFFSPFCSLCGLRRLKQLLVLEESLTRADRLVYRWRPRPGPVLLVPSSSWLGFSTSGMVDEKRLQEAASGCGRC